MPKINGLMPARAANLLLAIAGGTIMSTAIIQHQWLVLTIVTAATAFACIMYEWSRSLPSWSTVDLKLHKYTGPQPRRAIAAYHAFVTGQPMPLSDWEEDERKRRVVAAGSSGSDQSFWIDLPPEAANRT